MYSPLQTITGNIVNAREIWDQVIKRHRDESEAWIRYIDWEKLIFTSLKT